LVCICKPFAACITVIPFLDDALGSIGQEYIYYILKEITIRIKAQDKWRNILFSCKVVSDSPWTIALQAALSMGFPRQNYWSMCHLLQGIFLTQGSNSHPLHWQADFFTTEPSGKLW